MNLIPLVLAATLTPAQPAEPPTRRAVQLMAFSGAGLLAAGLAFEITGAGAPASTAPDLAAAQTVGGVALMSVGLCFLAIAAVLTPWNAPFSLMVTPTGALLSVRVPVP